MTQPIHPYPYPPPVLRCPQCGTELSPALLSCPRCQRLVHSERLNELAAQAKAAEAAGDTDWAAATWEQALALLPRDSRQHETVAARIEQLTRDAAGGIGIGTGTRSRSASAGRITGIGSLLVFLIAGLTKAKTFWTMLLALGVYWQAYGWKLALGLILSIYVHEMGHVAMLLRYGVRASAPMFIPGLGAVILLKRHPKDPVEDARIGLAGPTWGLGAALVAAAGWFFAGWPSWAAVAQLGGFINLFNLTPVWQLDGSRGFRALSVTQRWVVLVVVTGMYLLLCYVERRWWSFHTMLALVGVVWLLRCSAERKVERAEGDRVTVIQFVVLVVALSLLSTIHVPGVTGRW